MRHSIEFYVGSGTWGPLSTTPCLCGRAVRRSSQSWLQAVISPERAVQDNVSPCFSGCSRPEHSRVRCPGVSRHEQAHRLMASMGLSRLDDLSLCTEYSRTAGDTAASSSHHKTSSVCAFVAYCILPVYYMGIVSGDCREVDPLSSSFPQLWPSRVCTCPLHLFNDLGLVRSCDEKAYPADPRSKTIKLSDAAF